MSAEAVAGTDVSVAAAETLADADAQQHFQDVEDAAHANEELAFNADEESDDNSGEENAYSSDDESVGGDLEWNIGFVEEAPLDITEKQQWKHSLKRQHFPCKVGGAPAWLEPVDIPSNKQLKCLYTREPLDFLMQIYAPVDDQLDEPSAFHRSIFVFVSPHGGNLHRPGAVRVFRSQLARENAFYPDEPAVVGGVVQELTDDQQKEYDSKNDRWQENKTDVANVINKRKTFPERELIVEPETFEDEGVEGSRSGNETAKNEDDTTNVEDNVDKSKIENAAENNKVPESLRGKGADVSARELRELEKMQDKDMVQLSRFHLRLHRSDPEQCVRYCFDDGAEPLWPSVTNAPDHRDANNVPNCQRCGSSRKFEFQVLPQLINHLQVDSELQSAVDFGSIAVYTCSKSCKLTVKTETKDESVAYAEEVALVHPPLNA